MLRTPGQLTPLPGPTPSVGNWPSFRGPNATGVADGQQLPDTWDVKTGENIKCECRLPVSAIRVRLSGAIVFS